MTHELKTWPMYFNAVVGGTKRFEIREADRPFAVGDQLRLQEWDPTSGEYTGRETMVEVTYVLSGGPFRVPDHVVMSIRPVAPEAEVVESAIPADGSVQLKPGWLKREAGFAAPAPEKCPKCGGDGGFKRARKWICCPACNGTGWKVQNG